MTQVVMEGAAMFPEVEVLGDDEEPRSFLPARLARPVAALRAVPNLGTWAGVVLATAGLGLLLVAWGRTAALTNVALQVPYVISAGFTGLGLVVVGLTVVNIVAKRADAQARRAQLAELRTVLAELRAAVEEQR